MTLYIKTQLGIFDITNFDRMYVDTQPGLPPKVVLAVSIQEREEIIYEGKSDDCNNVMDVIFETGLSGFINITKLISPVPDTATSTQYPTMPLVVDNDGIVRFKGNPIVAHMLEQQQIWSLERQRNDSWADVEDADYMFFCQLAGYSYDGWCMLSNLYYSGEAYWVGNAKIAYDKFMANEANVA